MLSGRSSSRDRAGCGRPVAKVSDASGKTMSDDEEYLKYLKRSIDFRLQREKEKGR